MSYSSVPEALDYFSYQPLSSQHVVWPTMMCPPWNTMVFPEPDPTLRDSDHFQAPHLFIQRSRLHDAELEFDQYELPATKAEVDDILQTAHESSPARPEDIAMTRSVPIIRSLPDSDYFQAPHLFVQTGRLDDAELEFNQYAVPVIQPTEVDETQQPARESSPPLPEDAHMTRDVPTIRSRTLPNGRPTRPTKSNSVSLNKGRRESLSKTQRQERNKESATKHRGRLFKMIDDAWEMIPDDEKRGLGEKRTLKRLERLEIAIGYFSKLRRIHSQIIALLE